MRKTAEQTLSLLRVNTTPTFFRKKRARWIHWAFFLSLGVSGCSLLATRPVQEMSDTSAAMRAAREVQADTIAPDLYRKADEAWLKAQHEYKYKNFQEALDFANKARRLAEEAEFEAIRAGAARNDVPPDPLSTQTTQ